MISDILQRAVRRFKPDQEFDPVILLERYELERARLRRYGESEKGRESRRRHDKSEAGLASRRRRNESEKGRATSRRYIESGHKAYVNARRRCLDPRCKNHYGRGIKFLFESREQFFAEIGPRPPNPPGWKSRTAYWTLDRIDNDGNYEPGNVRWATMSEQARNRRRKK